jgi:hypothetical protein
MLALLMLLQAAGTQERPPATEPWQAAITSQIEAFRLRDAPGAFQYAAEGFHAMFPSAEAFFIVIVGSGYAPIMDSRSHSFGAFQVLEDKSVVQQVKFVGNDQSLYEATYQMGEEAAGWRVRAVQLVKQPGLGI